MLDFRVAVREAQGKDLAGWAPGQPLPKRFPIKKVIPMSASMCPFGVTCTQCQAGHVWNPLTAEHAKERTARREHTAAFLRRFKI